MTQAPEPTTKKNVSQFDDDVRRTGSYAYTTERLSARLANARMSRGILGLVAFDGTIVVIEPKGNNLVLKLIERHSAYHVVHEERSFSSALIRSRLVAASFRVSSTALINLVLFLPGLDGQSVAHCRAVGGEDAIA